MLESLLINENKNIIDAWKQMSLNAKKIDITTKFLLQCI